MAVVSFLFPLVGWITWGMKKNTEPEEAAKCAKWAWIGFAVNTVLMIALGGA